MEKTRSRSYHSTLWLLAAVVVLWRVAAYVVPDEGPDGWLRLALAGLGLLFVACGLMAYRSSPRSASLIFALYALCAGMHWGGPIGSSNLSENPIWLGVYLVVSSILAGSLFLHFALEFSPSWHSRARQWTLRAIYLPVVVAVVLLPIVVLGDTDQGFGAAAKAGSLAAYTFAIALPYLAAAVFLLRALKSESKAPAAIVFLGILLGALPSLLYSALGLPGPYDAYLLFSGLEPLAILVALNMEPEVRSD